jgi:hypothetical protein
MSKTNTEKITKLDVQIEKLKKQRQQAVKEEKVKVDKARKQQLLYRAEHLQKIAPHIADMTDSEYENYVSKLFSPETKSAPFAITQQRLLHLCFPAECLHLIILQVRISEVFLPGAFK